MIIITTTATPTHTPALNISPIAWHELNNVERRIMNSGILILNIATNVDYYIKLY